MTIKIPELTKSQRAIIASVYGRRIVRMAAKRIRARMLRELDETDQGGHREQQGGG